MKILILNNGIVSEAGMSGSDRRAIHWSKLFSDHHDVSVVAPRFAQKRFPRGTQQYHAIKKEMTPGLFDYLKRAFLGMILMFRLRNKAFDVVYSSSDLLPDAIPALFLKMLTPKIKWISGLHLIAPSPLKGYHQAYAEGRSMPGLKNIYYYITQSFILFFMRHLALLAFVSNHLDKQHLLKKRFKDGQVLVTYGAPEWDQIKQVSVAKAVYDVCFIARYHPQKGYDDLLQSWALVHQQIPDRRLAIIGDIPSDILKAKLSRFGISPDSVTFFGFVDGLRKYKILSQSRILAFPSLYESFGMVAVEAQACAVPVVAYNLPFYKRIYPKGMARIAIGDTGAFAEKIVHLLRHEDERQVMARDASQNAAQFTFEASGRDILNKLESER